MADDSDDSPPRPMITTEPPLSVPVARITSNDASLFKAALSGGHRPQAKQRRRETAPYPAPSRGARYVELREQIRLPREDELLLDAVVVLATRMPHHGARAQV